MPKSEGPDNRPIHAVRHRGLKASIWRNHTEKGPIYKVTITRSYRDKQSGEWRDTQSFGYDDLANIAALMYEAHSFISNLKAREEPASASRPQPATRQRRPARPQPQRPQV